MAARRPRHGRKWVTPPIVEAQTAVDVPAALVDEPVMAAAKQHEVVSRCLAASRPVVDVVGVEEAAILAAGKRQPRSRERNARLRAGGIVRVLRPLLHDGGVASKPTRGLRRERAAVLELAAALAVVG